MICLLERSLPLPLVLVPAVGSQPFCACSGSVKTKTLLNETLERNGITGILPRTTAHVHLNGDTWRGQHEGVACCRCKDTCGNPVPKMWQLHCLSFPSLALSRNISASELDPEQCWAPSNIRGFGVADGQNSNLLHHIFLSQRIFTDTNPLISVVGCWVSCENLIKPECL